MANFHRATRSTMLAAAVASAVLLFAPRAEAAGIPSIGPVAGAAFLTTTFGGPAAVLAACIWTTTRGGGPDDGDSKQAYIRENAVALQQDLTVGAGDAVRDLANLYGVDERHYEAFADMLQQRRDKLVPLTDIEELDRRRAEAFFRIIAEGMQSHPQLRAELRETESTGRTGGTLSQ